MPYRDINKWQDELLVYEERRWGSMFQSTILSEKSKVSEITQIRHNLSQLPGFGCLYQHPYKLYMKYLLSLIECNKLPKNIIIQTRQMFKPKYLVPISY